MKNSCFSIVSSVLAAVLSLTAPKVGIKRYAEEGRIHWLGGRFVPGELDARLGLNLPNYGDYGSSQCVDITLSTKGSKW